MSAPLISSSPPTDARCAIGHLQSLPPWSPDSASRSLNKIWRRYRLAQHDLDPNLVDVIKLKRDAHIHEDYIRRYGPRPAEAKWQANSSPF